MYAALRDCLQALKLDRNHMKAHLRLCRCLLELKWLEEAHLALQRFQIRFPEHACDTACITLLKDISAALEEVKSGGAATSESDPAPSLSDDGLNSSKT